MKHKKDIVVVYIVTKLELGGAQRVCLELVDGLRKEGHLSILISGSEGYLVSKAKSYPHIILLDTLKHDVSALQWLQELKTFIHLVQILKKLRTLHPHLIVHTHSTKAGILGRFAAWCAGISYRIHTIHGYAFHQHQGWISWFCRYLPELVASLITTHTICVSSQDVKAGIRLFPCFTRHHSVIRAAVSHPQIDPQMVTVKRPALSKIFVFGTISCFKPQKNLFDLLRAFELVQQQHAHARLEIIGDGALRPELEAWITSHKLTQNITLHGWQDNVMPYLAFWHAFTLSSLWEGLPCAIVEARLMKLPVACYDTGGIRDVIYHGENGLVCTQKDWRGLAANMQRLLEDTSLHQHMSSYADDLQDFFPHTMIAQHLDLYRSLL
jgi:glycosyltransferase involved in cell wall biosynthesis